MRIIAGEHRGRRIEGPKDDVTRPTADSVRESIFNILGERVVDARVVDLFAGSGALGLEALSRGAAGASFIEINRHNAALIKRNIASLGYGEVAQVSHADAHRFGRSFEPSADEPVVVFLDPPYLEYQRNSDKIAELISALASKCPMGSTIVVESGKHWDESILPELERWDIRRYGGTVVAFLRIDESDSELSDDDEIEANDVGIGNDGDEA